MPRMQRANVVLRVKEEEVQHYLKLGYTLTSESGKKVLTEAQPHDVSALQTALLAAQDKITSLESQVTSLTAELQKAKASKSKRLRQRKKSNQSEVPYVFNIC